MAAAGYGRRGSTWNRARPAATEPASGSPALPTDTPGTRRLHSIHDHRWPDDIRGSYTLFRLRRGDMKILVHFINTL